MENAPTGSLIKHFEGLPDPRNGNAKAHIFWVLDVAFREEESRVRQDHATENLAVLRHMALNLLKQETTANGGIRANRLQAGWNQDYLLTILRS